jgi:hypothetical protein
MTFIFLGHCIVRHLGQAVLLILAVVFLVYHHVDMVLIQSLLGITLQEPLLYTQYGALMIFCSHMNVDT